MTRQRIAHMNTNAFQQLHSYFVSTMSRPHDRQLISDTFAIDDSFMERTVMFQNGDWLMTSFKATNAQNVPVFFHSINKEDFILDQWKSVESTRNCRSVDFSMVVGFYDLKGTMTGGWLGFFERFFIFSGPRGTWQEKTSKIRLNELMARRKMEI